jgi:hypothetical protein
MADVASALHGWGHEDYEVAKDHIYRQLGSIDNLEVFGRQVLVAVYVRPAENKRTGLSFTAKKQEADWYEGKVVLVIRAGPSAFSGDDSYIESMYGDQPPPQPGDWLFQNANTGIQFSFQGDGSERVKYEDRHGETHDMYPGDGWQVRIVMDDGFLGRIPRPTSVV